MSFAKSIALLTFVLAATPAAASQHLVARRQERALKHESDMIRIPAGTFVMGADDTEIADFKRACEAEFGPEVAQNACIDDRSKDFDTGTQPRMVFVSTFEIDRYEVTTAQYRECVAHGPCDMRPLVAGDARYAVDEWPMVNVTWDDAVTYCAWRGKRLPTEAEWEKAARGVDGRRWPWGDKDRRSGANRGRVEPEIERPPAANLISGAMDDTDGFRELAPPGSLPFGRSPYGLHDMAGNVSEWVADWYDENAYSTQSTVDPTGPKSGHLRVTRGGSFFEPRFYARTYYRNAELPTERSITRGMRCAR
jgi:formylglycine-generating enzyme